MRQLWINTSERFVEVGTEVWALGGSATYVVDTETNVLYLYTEGYRQATMSPLFNADGTLMLYEGEIIDLTAEE